MIKDDCVPHLSNGFQFAVYNLRLAVFEITLATEILQQCCSV